MSARDNGRCPDVAPIHGRGASYVNAELFSQHRSVSFVVYAGPSQFDGAPIVVILTGFGRPSGNAKTGPMIQSYILRSDIHPWEALLSGRDRSVCGLCPWASGNGCYVNVPKSVTNVWKSWKAGNVPAIEPEHAAQLIHGVKRALRIGSYGDPAAAPTSLWRKLLVGSTSGHSGYSHAWRYFPQFRDIVMASADTAEDHVDATADGWRTFRVVGSVSEELGADEIRCPASTEAGKRTKCSDCLLCAGAGKSAKSIAIVDHGKFAPSGRKLAMAH